MRRTQRRAESRSRAPGLITGRELAIAIELVRRGHVRAVLLTGFPGTRALEIADRAPRTSDVTLTPRGPVRGLSIRVARRSER